MKKILLVSSIVLMVSGCDKILVYGKSEAQKHMDVCFEDETPLVQCYNIINNAQCQIHCLPKPEKIEKCVKLLSKNAQSLDETLKIYEKCEKPVVRWGTAS